jgi:hypothetical protein
MMKRFVFALLLILIALVGSVQAQEAPTLSTLEITLWPEFDKPEVLVIYRGLVAADTPLPVLVEIHLPARVAQPSAVAYVGEDGQQYNQEHTTRVEGESLVVSFELATPGFQLEYYDTLPVDSAGRRTYEYAYVADYPITALSLEFQVPPTAEGFTLEPAADSVTQQSDGLTYHLVQMGTVEQGETNTWTFTYQKADEDLTISGFVQPDAPEAAAPPPIEDSGNSAVWIFLVAFVALVSVGVAAFWLGRRAQPISQPPPPPSTRHKRRGSGRGEQPPIQRTSLAGSQEALFCHQCGAELRSDSEFCHRCGTQVRSG